MERIIPEALRERFPRMSTGHTVGRCAGEVVIFAGMPGARCATTVSADTGYVEEVPNLAFGTGMQRLYYCVKCADRKRGVNTTAPSVTPR